MEYKITIKTKSPIDNFIDELKERIAQHEDVTECNVHSYGTSEETRKLFDAPWEVRIRIIMSKVGDEIRVYDACKHHIATCDRMEDAILISHLPELYDALKSAVKEACGTCAMMHVNPDTYDFVENGCPFSEENNACDYRDCIAILQKVRDIA